MDIKHQLWPFWHPLLIYHVKDDKGDIIGLPNILTKDIKYQIFSQILTKILNSFNELNSIFLFLATLAALYLPLVVGGLH